MTSTRNQGKAISLFESPGDLTARSLTAKRKYLINYNHNSFHKKHWSRKNEFIFAE